MQHNNGSPAKKANHGHHSPAGVALMPLFFALVVMLLPPIITVRQHGETFYWQGSTVHAVLPDRQALLDD